MHSQRRLYLIAITVSLAVFATSWALAAAPRQLEFSDVRTQTAEFMRYNESIRLTSDQQQVFETALKALPAPCCSDNTALTCCCPCNSARTWWGLSKHLIADLGFEAEQVTAKVAEWFDFVNPKGFSGDVCYTRGCARSFAENGCGGMNPNHVAF